MSSENMQTRMLKHFEKVSNDPTNFYYKCLISDKCFKTISGKKMFNLVSHARTHTDFFREHFVTESGVLMNMAYKRLHYIQCCTEFVTINGQPFSALNKSGFKKLNAEKHQSLKNAGYSDGLGIKCGAVKEHVQYLSSEIVEEIKAQVKGQFISLMIDTATKYRRSIMGISLQFLRGSSIVIRSIGMIHLTSSHTGKYIADKVFEQLKLFDIKVSQVISITTDNATNMASMVNRCNDMYNEECEDSDDVMDSENYDDNDLDEDESAKQVNVDNVKFHNVLQHQYILTTDADVSTLIRNCLDEMESNEPNCLDETPLRLADKIADFEALIRDIEEIFADQTLNINGIRCAAHTLQLAVISALKTPEYQILVQLCRAVCKELRKETTSYELGENKIKFKIPRIDCLTRWNSTYTMVRIFFEYYLHNLIHSQIIQLQLLDLIEYCEAAIIFLAKKNR